MSEQEVDVFSTIMAFEQILEVMPDDRGALESVVRAYDEMGDQIQAKEYAMRLVRVLLDEEDVDAAVEYVDQLRAYAADDPEVVKLIGEFDALCGGDSLPLAAEDESAPVALPQEGTATEPSAPASKPKHGRVRMHMNVADEMAFAWNLLQLELLSEDEYAAIVKDLSELAGGNRAGTVSVLHILQDRAFKNLDRIIVAVAREAGVPLIMLSQFDIQKETAKILPLQFTTHRGALPFDTIGTDVMVAILNPYDETLRKDTQLLAERKCHWYLTGPAAFDAAVHTIREMLKDD